MINVDLLVGGLIFWLEDYIILAVYNYWPPSVCLDFLKSPHGNPVRYYQPGQPSTGRLVDVFFDRLAVGFFYPNEFPNLEREYHLNSTIGSMGRTVYLPTFGILRLNFMVFM